MATYLRPKRGTANNSNVVLKEGEIFFDDTNRSSATTLSSWGKIYVGDGVSKLKDIEPFVALPQEMTIEEGITATGDTIDNNMNLVDLFSATKNLLISGNTDPVVKDYSTNGTAIVTKIGNFCQLYVTYPTNIDGHTTSQYPIELGVITDEDFLPDHDLYFIASLYNNMGSTICDSLYIHINATTGLVSIVNFYGTFSWTVKFQKQIVIYNSKEITS